MKEHSLVLIKPDGVEKKVVGKIISIYEENGLEIADMRLVRPTREIAEKHYEEHVGREYFPRLIECIISGPVIALVLEGEDAIAKVRKLNGATNPDNAEEGTIRKLYATNGTINTVHASDSVENANREISIWFN
ncbi:nucleoside-diphosphate kinase [Clostridium bornimense]|uniref:nucleoside-diphosphate kinase n=1 Tax=Clostridium bornimense TaxID=1216932 RepID=UPI001C106004|nr:nucleoside-diphosphate kinase [Clostridium bornimense]MBU5317179.1 nucleoside-diphosphate kinase [Clostridium bornimense]